MDPRDETEPLEGWDSATFELTGSRALTSALLGDPDERYERQSELGRGGLGAVHAVMDQLLEREVALKVSLSEDNVDLIHFWHEARVTALLDHPNIVPVYDAGLDEDGQPYYIMKKVVGADLTGALAAGRLPSLRRRLEVFRSLCDAVAYAHEKGWLHRDIKPENVMLGDHGEVLLVDWGLAWSLEAHGTPPRAGTPRFMPPEQARGEPQDERADIFALGGGLYVLLTGGDLPFPDAEDAYAIVKQILKRQTFRPPRRAAPRELLAIVDRALAPDPADRYPSVADLQADLEAWLDDREVSAATYSLPQRLQKWGQRNRDRLFTITIATVLIGVVLGLAGTATSGAILMSALTASASRDAALAAAEEARQAEQARRLQLHDALLAGSAGYLAQGRFANAEDNLLEAERIGVDDPARKAALGLAWADLTRRGLWPVWREPLDAMPVDLQVLPDDAGLIALYADGSWTRRRPVSARIEVRGSLGAAGLSIVGADQFVVRDGARIALVDASGAEQAAADLPTDLEILGTWAVADRLLVTGRLGNAFTTRAYALPTLEPQPLSKPLSTSVLHDVSPDGSTLIAGATPDRTQSAWVFGPDGRRAIDDVLVVVDVDGDLVDLGADGGFRGVASSTVVAGFSENGAGRLYVDSEAGTRLLGGKGRPEVLAIDPDARWLVAATRDQRLVCWALPESPLNPPTGGGMAVHSDGRLAVDLSDPATILDLPTGTRLHTFPGGWSNAAWSPDGAHLALSTNREAAIHDLLASETTRVEGASGPPVWTNEQLLFAGTPVVQLDASGRQQTRVVEQDRPTWNAVPLQDRKVAVAYNLAPDERVGALLHPDGTLQEVRSAVLPGYGFGVSVFDDGRLAFARQDGTVAIVHADGRPDVVWRWQPEPVMAVVPVPGAVAALTFYGDLDVLNERGEPLYTLQLEDDGPYIRLVRAGDLLVALGGGPGQVLPIDGRPPPRGARRLANARAWSRLTDPGPEERLSAAIATGADLEGNDPTSRLVRALRSAP